MPVATATMDNPNPVIFSSKKDVKREVRSIWIESPDDLDIKPEEDDTQTEVIDGDEVYGMRIIG